jgi:hypothetical protein
LDSYVGGELKKGQTPKKIFNHLVGKKYDKLSVQGKRQVGGIGGEREAGGIQVSPVAVVGDAGRASDTR